MNDLIVIQSTSWPMYQIIDVPPWAAESTEQIGTKYKFWYSDDNGLLILFKEGRPGTGENWAEKIACELAELIGLPHAHYELARWQNLQGVISNTVVLPGSRLIHGNELLATFVAGYGENPSKPVRRKEHTLRRVLSYFRGGSELIGTPPGFVQTHRVSNALDIFIGYLMFDAWIANQDRHDQNWGILRTSLGNSFLAPSFDHGSSMGRNESDEKRSVMLSTKDMGRHITRYIALARSAMFPIAPHGTRIKALYTLEAFESAAIHAVDAASEWRDRLEAVDHVAVERIIDNIPDTLMTDVARQFTFELLKLNRDRLLHL